MTGFKAIAAIGIASAVCLTPISAIAFDEPAHLAATTSVVIDRSTPAAGYQVFLDAVDRNDVDTVADSLFLPFEISAEDRKIDARRWIVATRLAWAIDAKFGSRARTMIAAYAGFSDVPRLKAPKFVRDDERQLHGVKTTYPPNHRHTAMADEPNVGHVPMVLADGTNWKLNRGLANPRDVAFAIEDTPARIKLYEFVIEDLNAGHFAGEADVLAALIPPATAPVAGSAASDRKNPEDVNTVAIAAIDAGDLNTLLDCYTRDDGQISASIRMWAELMIDSVKLNKSLHDRFGKEQGDRLAKECMLTRLTGAEGIVPSNLKWIVDGDVAHALRGNRRENIFRMLRRDGKWRIEQPPARFEKIAEQRFGRDDIFMTKLAKMKEILAHPEKYPDPGSVFDAIGFHPNEDMRPNSPEHEAAATQQAAETRDAIARNEKDLAEQRVKLPADEVVKREIGLSLSKQIYKDGKPATEPVETMYFVDGRGGSDYVHARFDRVRACNELAVAMSRQIGSGADGVLHQFDITNSSDDMMMLGMSGIAIVSPDRANFVPEDKSQAGQWEVPLRKVNGEWRIDLSDETANNPTASAIRAESEATAIRHIIDEVNQRHLTTADAVAAELRVAGVKGTGKGRGKAKPDE